MYVAIYSWQNITDGRLGLLLTFSWVNFDPASKPSIRRAIDKNKILGILYIHMTQTAPVAPVAPVAPASASAPAPIQAAPEHKGWSWGALMLGPMFLIGIKKYIYLLLYLLFLIPLVNIVVFFAIP